MKTVLKHKQDERDEEKKATNFKLTACFSRQVNKNEIIYHTFS